MNRPIGDEIILELFGAARAAVTMTDAEFIEQVRAILRRALVEVETRSDGTSRLRRRAA